VTDRHGAPAEPVAACPRRGRFLSRQDAAPKKARRAVPVATATTGRGGTCASTSRCTPRRSIACSPPPAWRLDRVHEKPAIFYAAGCLAIRFSILPWKRERIRTPSCRTRGHVALVTDDQGRCSAAAGGAAGPAAPARAPEPG
jgi:hypothetical protein